MLKSSDKKAKGALKCPPHPCQMGGLCRRCGEQVDDESCMKVTYIHKNMRLSDDEIDRVRARDLENLLHRKKLHLVLDLDHTLLSSIKFAKMTEEELKMVENRDSLPAPLKDSLIKLDAIHRVTRLRPYVHTFLKEVKKLFELQIYTKGRRVYALQMEKLLDPDGVYFQSRVIAREDCRDGQRKGLDIFLGSECSVIILDDSESVWDKHKDNLILMKRYNYFPSSCKKSKRGWKPLCELERDENEGDGALVSILKVLQRIHSLFFDQDQQDDIWTKDVRKVLKAEREKVLKGCKIVINKIYSKAENHRLWRMAEELGATCTRELDISVTHVVSLSVSTEKSLWAVNQKKFLVHPRWIEASNYLWLKQPEEKFPVTKPGKSNAPSQS